MSIFNCHKQEPQPWMSYISRNKITYSGDCCPVLVTLTTELPPFQIISEGDFIRCEISVFGSDVWTEITIPITTVITDGFYIHSYDGTALGTPLDCGPYEFRLIAGETWWFEPIMIEDFEHTENSFTARDLLMTPLKFSEQRFDTLPLIAQCDEIMPFMFTTENPSTAPAYTLVDSAGNEAVLTITVDVRTINGRTYYIHDGECLYPFLECGQYYIRINDGAFTYYSVPFNAECGMNDIPDGYRPMRDFNGCVMRDDEGNILTEACSLIPEDIKYGHLYNWYAVTDIRGIVASGWHIPTPTEFQTLSTYLGGNSVSGGKLKETGFDHWASPNTGATNASMFNGKGAGSRRLDGTYEFIQYRLAMWTATLFDATRAVYSPIFNSSAIFQPTGNIAAFNYGNSIRPLKDSTTLIDGQSGIYIGNDGKVYRTICIGTLEWLADNLAETKYRNGDDIPEVANNAAWAALVTGALCAYNNDWNNV